MRSFKDERRAGRGLITRIRARFAQEHGQSLIIVTLAMVGVLGMAAIAIDVATWYQKHHQAQVAADAAALAAANCLANESGTSTCTSASDESDASTVAATYGTANGVPVASTTYATATGGAVTSVKVKTQAAAPIVFASALGFGSPTVSATAVASVTTPTTTTTVNDAIFAENSSCSSSSEVYQTANGLTINGAVVSNGAINVVSRTNFDGPVESGRSCPMSSSSQRESTFNDGQPFQATSSLPYPVPYIAPGSAGAPSCTYTAGQGSPPSGVTDDGTNLTINSTTAGVYCAPHGNITDNAGGCKTFYAQTVDLRGNGATYTPVGLTSGSPSCASQSGITVSGIDNTLLAYCSSSNDTTGSPACDAGGNTSTSYNGSLFAPNGMIYFTANGAPSSFLEGWDVYYAGNTGGSFNASTETVTTTTGAPTDTLTG